MKPPVALLGEEAWNRLCGAEEVRPAAVAAARARLEADRWPPSLEVVDALLRAWLREPFARRA